MSLFVLLLSMLFGRSSVGACVEDGHERLPLLYKDLIN